MSTAFIFALVAYFSVSILLYSILLYLVTGLWTERKFSRNVIIAFIWSLLGIGVLVVREMVGNDLIVAIMLGVLSFFLLVILASKVYELALSKSVLLMGLSWGISLMIGLVIYFPLVSFFPIYQQMGTSMESILPDGERIVFFRSENIERGDIIVFHPSFAPNEAYLKRVIGLPGETIQLRKGSVFVNDRLLSEPYLAKDVVTCVTAVAQDCSNDNSLYRVPEKSYFVLGDNRTRSSDSRAWYDRENRPIPFVESTNVKGKMIFSITSPSKVVDRPILGEIPVPPATQHPQTELLPIAETPTDSENTVSSLSDESTESVPEKPVEANKNWDHVAKSLTQYLIWSGKKVALVEHCLDGYEDIYKSGNYTCKGSVYDDKRWLEFEWLDGRRIKAPEELSRYFLMDFNNIGGPSFQYSITSDENHMIYLDFWSDDESRVVSVDLANAKQETLMSFLASSNGACNGERFFGKNPSRSKLGIVIANEGVYGKYPNNTKVFILTIENGKLIKKNNYIIPVVADCSPNNGPFFSVGWVDDDTIGYFDPNDNPYGDDTKDDYDSEYMEQFFHDDDRWTSKYARFYDVD